MPGVTVTFGANIDALVDGVKDARAAIESFMAAFAVDKLADFADAYAKLGSQIETGARQFGETTSQFQEIGYIAKMAGDENGNLATVFGRLEQTLQQAQNPTTRQALALAALGLSAKELIGLPLDAQLGKIADAFARSADGTNKAAIAQALFRNSSGELIEMLDQGSGGLARMRQQAIDTGAVLSGQTLNALTDIDHASVALKATMSSLGGELVALASKTLVEFETETTQSAADLVKLVESGNLGSYALRELRGIAEQLTAQLGRLGTALKLVFTGNFGANFTKGMEAANAIAAATDKKLEGDLAAIENNADAAYKALLQVHTAGAGKPQLPAMNTNVAAETALAQSAMQAQIKSVDDYFAHVKEGLSADLAAHRITYDQETQELIAAIRQRDISEQTWYDSEIALVKAAGKNFEAVEKEKVAAHDKAMLEIQKATDAAVKQDTKDWQSVLQPIESAWNSQLRALLTGTETWSQAMKKIFADLAMQAIEKLETIGVEKLAGGLASAFGGGPASLLGGGNAAGAPLNLLPGAAGAASSGGGIFSGLMSLFKLFAIPGFAVGTDAIKTSGLAFVDQGEQIVPAQGSGPYSGVNAGGDTHVHNWNISAIDGASMQRWLGAGGARQIANAVAGVQKVTPSMAW
jgi:hypothetical protein